jgi:hypothetical protein
MVFETTLSVYCGAHPPQARCGMTRILLWLFCANVLLLAPACRKTQCPTYMSEQEVIEMQAKHNAKNGKRNLKKGKHKSGRKQKR